LSAAGARAQSNGVAGVPGLSGILPLTAGSVLVYWPPGSTALRLVAEGASGKAGVRAVRTGSGWAVMEGLLAGQDYRFRLTDGYILGPVRFHTHGDPYVEWGFVPAPAPGVGERGADAPLLLSRTEITNELYLRYCREAGAPYPEEPNFRDVRDYLQNYPHHPVVNVTWHGAAGFCDWLSRTLGLPPGSVRLPAEAEWERAARASSGLYPWGDARPDKTRAHYGDSRPARVGSYPASPDGLWDLAGNVWEWCRDWYVPEEPSGAAGEPLFKVVRGGSWADPPDMLRMEARGKLSPGVGLSTVGFRVARPLPEGFPGAAAALMDETGK